MVKHHTRSLFAGVLVAAVTLLGGCSSGPPPVELPDPKDVPREKWSDALLIMDAMGIPGQRDVPRELANAYVATKPGDGSISGGGDIAIASASLAAPPGGMSGGAAAGVGLGLMLLGGRLDPAYASQVAAWVPADQATSPQAAAELVLRTYQQMRKQVFVKGLSNVSVQVGKFPDLQPGSYASLQDSFAERPIAFDTAPTAAPAMLGGKPAYGPIFIRSNQFVVDAIKNDLSRDEAMTLASRHLPDWFYIYQPGQKLRKNSVPAVVYNQGKANYFIGK